MKKIKIPALLAALTLLAALCACGEGVSSSSPLLSSQKTSAGPPITVYVASVMNADMDIASTRAQEAGFSITFEQIAKSELLDVEAFFAEHPQAVIINNPFLLYQALEGAAHMLGDFYNEAARLAPSYLAFASGYNRENELRLMPVQDSSMILSPFVLVRNDIAAEYGKGIDSVGDYRDLLVWVREHYPGTAPGAAAPLLSDQNASLLYGHLALNLFLPEMGYTSLAGMFDSAAGIPGLWLDKDGYACAFYQLDDAAAAFDELEWWRRDGLLEFVEAWPEEQGYYPTILANIGGGLKSVDILDGYTVYYLPGAKRDTFKTDVAVAAPGAQVGQFLCFMEWLEEFENYTFFMCGKAGADYTWNEQTGYVEIDDIEQYNRFGLHSVFMKLKFNTMLYETYHTSLTASLHLAAEGRSAPEYPLDVASRLELQQVLANEGPDEYKSFVTGMNSQMNQLVRALYGNTSRDNQGRAGETLAALRELPGASWPADRTNEALEKQ